MRILTAPHEDVQVGDVFVVIDVAGDGVLLERVYRPQPHTEPETLPSLGIHVSEGIHAKDRVGG